VITITLLHPTQSTPTQSWTFESEDTVRIGRARTNNVVLYSAVVSRHHVELQLGKSGWKVVNISDNGTYINDRPIKRKKVIDGMIIRLATSGPKIQINLNSPQESIAEHQVNFVI
jgi:pSer/pThr/pTyr-binding forkhead associated (FHA) protein